MPNYFISVIIPVYNGKNTLELCLKSIFNSDYPIFECIVVDDFSTDNSVQIAETFNVKVVPSDSQKGAAHARNRGAEVAGGDILLFVDADVTIYPDSIRKVAKAFEEYPDISALFGSYDDHPGCPNFFSQYKNLFHHYIHQTSREDASTFWSGFGAIKKEVFFTVNGFDQNKYSNACIEDIEMGSRLKKMGYQILLYKQLQVKHLKRYSFSNLWKSDLFDRAIPWTIVMLSNRKLTSDLNLKHEHKLSAGILFCVIFFILLTLKSIWFLVVIPFLLLIFFILNHDFYSFFLNKKGRLFTLKIIPFHFLYYLYSTLGFLIGSFKYVYDKHTDIIKNITSKKGI